MPEAKRDSVKTIGLVRVADIKPLPRIAEYIYFALVLYAMVAPIWGISVPLLGAGGMALLAMGSVWWFRRRATSIYASLALPLGCGVAIVMIQVLVHGQGITESANREFINWMLAIILVQALLLRENFLHRFAIAALIAGLLLLPYLVEGYGGGWSQRSGLEYSVGMANPNDLAAWFGFCCVYFGIVTIETRQNIIRIASLLVAAGCLFVVGLTVSRTALVAIALALIIAARRILKRGFVPVLLMAIVTSGLVFSGVFNEAIGLYAERGMEETGRFLVWPIAIQRIIDSPLAGVGTDDVDTYVWLVGESITPHNSLLYVGLASGVFPLTLFLLFWFKAARRAYHLSNQGAQDAPFQLPLIVYAILIMLSSAGAFMFPWAIVTLCNAFPRNAGRVVALRLSMAEMGERSRRLAGRWYRNTRHPATVRSGKS